LSYYGETKEIIDEEKGKLERIKILGDTKDLCLGCDSSPDPTNFRILFLSLLLN
jgi:hypothetical protein